jgi:hypothetical protein
MNKKLTAIFATMLIALCLAGVSYAMWSKTLYIDGTVYGGTLSAKWISATNFDLGLDPEWGFQTTKDKNVGSTTVTGIGTDTLVVTVNNAYPCYCNDLEVEYEYTGTVPVRVQSITIIPNGFRLASAYGANDGEIYIVVVDGIGTQLHNGQTGASSFKFHVEQCAVQGATYTFTVQVLLVQYNEYVPPPS